MTRSEPAARPKTVVLLDENARKRAIAAAAATTRSRRPRMPPHVRQDPLARREWRRLVPLLDGMGILRRADGHALGMLCWDLAILERLRQEMLQSGGPVIHTADGKVELSPLLDIIDKFHELVWRWFGEFGLTPASRAQVAVDPDAAKGKNGRGKRL